MVDAPVLETVTPSTGGPDLCREPAFAEALETIHVVFHESE